MVNKRIQDFDPVAEVNESDIGLIVQEGITKRFNFSQIPTTYAMREAITSLINPISAGFSGRITSVDNRVTVLDERVTSLGNDVTQVVSSNNVVKNQVSVLTDIVTSVANITNGLDSRITSVNQIASVAFVARTSLDGRITSVMSDVNSVSNKVSVVDSRVTSVQAALTSVNGYFVGEVSRLDGRIDSVSSNVTGKVSKSGDTVTGNIGFTNSAALIIGSIAAPGNADLTLMRGAGGLASFQIGGHATAANNFVISNNTNQQLVFSYGNAGGAAARFIIDGSAGGALRPATLGTSVNPVFSFNADPDTGLMSPGANQLALVVGSVAAVRIDSVNSVVFPGAAPVFGADPVTSLQGATKQYVDAVSSTLRTDITSVRNLIRTNFTSLADTSLAIGAGTNGYAVTWDNAQTKFILSSISGGGGGDLTSVDNRVTSVNNYFLNQVSVINAAATSIATRVNTVSGLVTTTSAALETHINAVSNTVSILTSVNNKQHNDLAGLIEATSIKLANNLAATSSALRTDITSVRNLIRTNLTSLADTSLATGVGTNGYAVTWDNSQSKFILTSVGGGGGGTSVSPVSIAVSSFVFGSPTTTISVADTITDKTRGFLFVQGVYQNKNTYSTSGNSITLTSALPVGVTAEWVYIGGGNTFVVSVGGGDVTSVDNRVTALSYDFISGLVAEASIQRYDIDRRAVRKYLVRSVFAATSSGQCTYSLRKNGTNLTGFTSVNASVNTSVVTSGTLVTVEVGDRLDLNITANTSAMDYAFTIGIQKV